MLSKFWRLIDAVLDVDDRRAVMQFAVVVFFLVVAFLSLAAAAGAAVVIFQEVRSF